MHATRMSGRILILVPDYLTSVRDGAFYGWPYSYYGQHVDARVKPQDSAAVARAVVPDYALGAHVAALGLVDATASSLPAPYRNGMFVGEHGSWNRKPAAGYQVADDVGNIVWRVSAAR